MLRSSSPSSRSPRPIHRDDDRQAAFTRCVERHRSLVESVVRRFRHESEAADLVQDVFLAAWAHWGSFRGESEVGTWLYSIARNRAARAVTTRLKREAREQAFGARWESAGSCPEQAAVAAEAEGSLRAELRRMPAGMRTVVLERLLHGTTYECIAERHAIAIGTAHRRDRIARDRLRAALSHARSR